LKFCSVKIVNFDDKKGFFGEDLGEVTDVFMKKDECLLQENYIELTLN